MNNETKMPTNYASDNWFPLDRNLFMKANQGGTLYKNIPINTKYIAKSMDYWTATTASLKRQIIILKVEFIRFRSIIPSEIQWDSLSGRIAYRHEWQQLAKWEGGKAECHTKIVKTTHICSLYAMQHWPGRKYMWEGETFWQ